MKSKCCLAPVEHTVDEIADNHTDCDAARLRGVITASVAELCGECGIVLRTGTARGDFVVSVKWEEEHQ